MRPERLPRERFSPLAISAHQEHQRCAGRLAGRSFNQGPLDHLRTRRKIHHFGRLGGSEAGRRCEGRGEEQALHLVVSGCGLGTRDAAMAGRVHAKGRFGPEALASTLDRASRHLGLVGLRVTALQRSPPVTVMWRTDADHHQVNLRHSARCHHDLRRKVAQRPSRRHLFMSRRERHVPASAADFPAPKRR